MAYDRIVLKNACKGVSLVQAANTSLYKMVVPAGGKKFTLQRVFQRITAACGGTTLAQIKIIKTPSGGQAATLKTCTANGLTDAIGVCTEDEVVNITGCTNVFGPGDTLDIQIAVTATATGSADIDLEIGLQD